MRLRNNTNRHRCSAHLLALALAVAPLLAQAAEPRRMGPAMDLASAPVPKVASQGARESFDRAQQVLQRVRALNQQANSRRQDAAAKDDSGKKPRPRPIPKPVKTR